MRPRRPVRWWRFPAGQGGAFYAGLSGCLWRQAAPPPPCTRQGMVTNAISISLLFHTNPGLKIGPGFGK